MKITDRIKCFLGLHDESLSFYKNKNGSAFGYRCLICKAWSHAAIKSESKGERENEA